MRQSHKIILASLVLGCVVACANLVPRKGWSPDQGPVVPHDTFPADCSLCHESGSWNKIKADFSFDHEKETGVKLNGAHDTAQCLLCHNDRGPVKQFAEKGCRGCHEDVHRGQLGALCQQCHNEDTWRPLQSIAEHARTRFPLIGGHAAVDCTSCHPNASDGVFVNASIECEACHAKDVTRSPSVDHIALGLTQGCNRCHTPVSWTPASFVHPASFPLTAGHGGVNCNSCHTTPGVFTGLSTDCVSCHLPNFQATTNPNHVAAGFSTNCKSCHNTAGWQGANFIHPASFPLTNGHSAQACNACHTTPGVYTGLSTACVSCHLPQYQATTNPNHASAGFSTDCQTCHSTVAWPNATFNHPASFPLSNGHSGRTCVSCHTTPGVWTGLSTSCVSCHLPQYQATTAPNHAASGFSTDCTTCHTTSTWLGASFNHPATFPLSNGHAGRACNACHTTPGVYTGLSTTCVSCHLPEYQATTNPNHAAAGLSTDCKTCHNTTAWPGANFNHPASFPLTQAHAGRTCSQCHTTPGVYTGLSTSCVSCHLAKYQATTNPNHTAAGFPTSCQTCHTPTLWTNGTFNHPSTFPLTNAHAVPPCSRCHTTPNVFTGLTPTCLNCHRDDFQRGHNSQGNSNCKACHNTRTWN